MGQVIVREAEGPRRQNTEDLALAVIHRADIRAVNIATGDMVLQQLVILWVYGSRIDRPSWSCQDVPFFGLVYPVSAKIFVGMWHVQFLHIMSSHHSLANIILKWHLKVICVQNYHCLWSCQSQLLHYGPASSCLHNPKNIINVMSWSQYPASIVTKDTLQMHKISSFWQKNVPAPCLLVSFGHFHCPVVSHCRVAILCSNISHNNYWW